MELSPTTGCPAIEQPIADYFSPSTFMRADDPYATLGVLPDAEDIVIRAAYKALAHRYHPDRWSGDPDEAHQRMCAINSAYAVLGDQQRRAAYDQSSRPSRNAAFEDQQEAEQGEAFAAALAEVEERWALACSVYPDLVGLRSGLAKVSTSLAFAFVTVCLDSRAFAHRAELASTLEKRFLERYFGTNPGILAYARRLIADGEKAAARELNMLVDVLGSDPDPNLLIARVDEKFGLVAKRDRARLSEEQRLAAETLAREVRTYGNYGDAERLARLMGYQVSEVGRGFFKSGEIAAIDSNGTELRFKGYAAFIYWVQNTLSRKI